MSVKRPKATDGEDDLLALQERFLSSGEKPSALLKKVKVQGNVQESVRDVVRLNVKGASCFWKWGRNQIIIHVLLS